MGTEQPAISRIERDVVSPALDTLIGLAEALVELEAEAIELEEFAAAGEFDLRPDFDGLGRDGGGWKKLSRHAIARSFLGHQCLFCSYDDLIRMKRGTGRPQDEIDIRNLRAARGEL